MSIILGSIRADNIISTRYVFLFIPGYIACVGWLIKGTSYSLTNLIGVSAVLQYSLQSKINSLLDSTGIMFSGRSFWKSNNDARVKYSMYSLFFVLVLCILIALTVQVRVYVFGIIV